MKPAILVCAAPAAGKLEWRKFIDSAAVSDLEVFDMNDEESCRRLTVADALRLLPGPDAKQFATVFGHGTLLVEIYAPRGTDPQQPHTRDEIYFVAAGSGEYVCGDTRQMFGPRDVLFAAAGVSHCFENFSEDFAVWVLFYGPEGGEGPKA